MAVSLKSLSKKVYIDILPLALEEHNGDKAAYFLEELQNEIAQNYIVQYGNGMKSILIYAINASSPMPEWQQLLPHTFGIFLRSIESKAKTLCLTIPISFLRSRAREHFLIRVKKITPIFSSIDKNAAVKHVTEKTILTLSPEGRYEVYTFHSWVKAGIKYRSEKS